MAQNEVTVKVSTETDTSDLDSLEDRLNGTHTFNIESPELANITEEIENQKQIIEELKAYGLDTSEAEAELQELETEFDNLQSSIDGSTGSVDDLTSSLDSMAMLQVGEVLQSYGSSAEDLAQQMNEASITVGQLATNTGIAEPQLVDMINHISNATFPQNEAIAYVDMLNQMGVKADRLGDSATNIDRINDATGMGYQNAMQLVRGFGALGVSGDNLESTFNAVAYAEANSIGGADEMGTILKRQAGTLNEYHVGVDAATVAISDLSHKYGSAMKAGGALSKALKDNNGDLRAVEQQLGLQEGALTNATDLTGQYQGKLMELADEEAEHKTWLDQLGAAWEDFSLSMSGALEPFMSLFGLSGQLAGFGMQLNGTWELLSKFKNVGFIKNLTGHIGGLGSKITGLGGSAKNALTHMTGLFRSIGSGAVNVVKGAVTSFADLGKNVLLAGANALKAGAMWLINAARTGISTLATWAATAAQGALNFVMSMNPIMLVVLAIVALIAVLGYLYFNNEQVRAAIDGLGQTFMWVGQIMYDSIINAVNWIIGALQNLWNYIITLGGLLPQNVSITGNQIVDTILRVLAFIFTLPMQIGMVFLNIIAKTLGFGDNFVQKMIQGGVNAVNGLINQIATLPGRIQQEFQRILQIVTDFITSLPQRVWDLGASIVNALLGALGIHSPGFMYYAVQGELKRIEGLPENMETGITGTVSRLGSQITDSFNPTLDYEDGTINAGLNELVSSKGTQSQGSIIFNLYGDMDSEDRMNRFVDAVIHRLNFENTTAGRTV